MGAKASSRLSPRPHVVTSHTNRVFDVRMLLCTSWLWQELEPRRYRVCAAGHMRFILPCFNCEHEQGELTLEPDSWSSFMCGKKYQRQILSFLGCPCATAWAFENTCAQS